MTKPGYHRGFCMRTSIHTYGERLFIACERTRDDSVSSIVIASHDDSNLEYTSVQVKSNRCESNRFALGELPPRNFTLRSYLDERQKRETKSARRTALRGGGMTRKWFRWRAYNGINYDCMYLKTRAFPCPITQARTWFAWRIHCI